MIEDDFDRTVRSGREVFPLCLRDVSLWADSRPLLLNANIEIPAGLITVIVGPSGAGKSVLLRILAGLIPHDAFPLRWTGAIDHGDDRPLQRVGIVFQNFALFDELSPLGNVRFARDHRRRQEVPPEQSPQQWLDELRVPTNLPVSALSGGQKQRLAIARTLAADPEVVLYDEPTSGLDAGNGQRVARLIRRTQQTHLRTSVVVTHDYETLLGIADRVLLFDTQLHQLVSVPQDQWSQIPARLQHMSLLPATNRLDGREPESVSASDVTAETSAPEQPSSLVSLGSFGAGGRKLSTLLREGIADFLITTGNVVLATVRAPVDLIPRWPKAAWGFRFLLHDLRLVAGPSAWLYLLLSGMIAGFTTTYFTFQFFPYGVYTKPLLLEDLLAAIGFALYRVLVPVLATILIAARCGAAVAADVGVKRYGSQIEALQTLGIPPRIYLLTPILLAFVLGTPLLEMIAFWGAKTVSLLCFAMTHPEQGPYFWQLHFDRQLESTSSFIAQGFYWLQLKNILSGLGIGFLAYYQGARPKRSAIDVSQAITATVLWATLYVLMVHFVIAFYEFD